MSSYEIVPVRFFFRGERRRQFPKTKLKMRTRKPQDVGLSLLTSEIYSKENLDPVARCCIVAVVGVLLYTDCDKPFLKKLFF